MDTVFEKCDAPQNGIASEQATPTRQKRRAESEAVNPPQSKRQSLESKSEDDGSLKQNIAPEPVNKGNSSPKNQKECETKDEPSHEHKHKHKHKHHGDKKLQRGEAGAVDATKHKHKHKHKHDKPVESVESVKVAVVSADESIDPDKVENIGDTEPEIVEVRAASASAPSVDKRVSREEEEKRKVKNDEEEEEEEKEGEEGEYKPDTEEIDKEAKQLLRMSKEAKSSKHPYHGVRDAVSGRRELGERKSKLKAAEVVKEYVNSGMESVMQLSDDQLIEKIHENLRECVEECKRFITSKYASSISSESSISDFSTFAAWTVVRQDIAYVALGKMAGKELPPEYKGYKELVECKRIIDDINIPRTQLMKLVSQILFLCCKALPNDRSQHGAGYEMFEKRYAIMAAVSKCKKPPVASVMRNVSNGEMKCDFTGDKIPVGEQPYKIVYTILERGDSFSKCLPHEIEMDFVVSGASKDILEYVYNFWNWPVVIKKRLQDLYQIMGGAKVAEEEAITKLSEGIKAKEMWTKFHRGKKVAIMIMSSSVKAADEYLKMVADYEVSERAAANTECPEKKPAAKDPREPKTLKLSEKDSAVKVAAAKKKTE